MQQNVEQRCAIKFCVKLEKSATETIAMLEKAYGEDSLSRAEVFRWHKAFREGRENAEDEERSRRPTTAHTSDNADRVNCFELRSTSECQIDRGQNRASQVYRP